MVYFKRKEKLNMKIELIAHSAIRIEKEDGKVI